MQPGNLNLVIYQGSTKEITVQWKAGDPAVPVDITNYKARMQVRKRVSDTTILDELTTENSRIAITDAALGKLVLKFPASVTSAMTFCTGVYDLELIAPDNVTVYRILEGNFSLSLEVTRA